MHNRAGIQSQFAERVIQRVLHCVEVNQDITLPSGLALRFCPAFDLHVITKQRYLKIMLSFSVTGVNICHSVWGRRIAEPKAIGRTAVVDDYWYCIRSIVYIRLHCLKMQKVGYSCHIVRIFLHDLERDKWFIWASKELVPRKISKENGVHKGMKEVNKILIIK